MFRKEGKRGGTRAGGSSVGAGGNGKGQARAINEGAIGEETARITVGETRLIDIHEG